ncbi:MAG: bacteriohemerythrin [Alphaproteobacteria bacterium]|nr:bacteriohemerythrin [Alphaproteobacteria bacterium]
MILQRAYLTKIILAFILSNLLGIILVAAFINEKLTEIATEQWGYKHQAIASNIAEHIEETLNHAQKRLEQTASRPELSHLPHISLIDRSVNGLPVGLAQETRSLFDTLLEDEDAFSVIFLLKPNGDHYISHPFSTQKNLKKYNLSDRPYFKAATESKKPTLSDSLLGADGISAVVIDVPLLSPEKEIYGHIGGVLHLPQLNTLIKKAVEGPFDQWVLLGRKNQLISGWTDDQSIIDQHMELIKQSVKGVEKHKPRGALAKDSGIKTLKGNKQNFVVNVTTLEPDWKLVMMRGTNTIESAVRKDVIGATAVIALVLFIISAISIVVVTQIGRRWKAAEQNVREANRNLEQLVLAQNSSLKEGEHRYHLLLDSLEVSIWEEDFSKIFLELETLRKKGVTDIRDYFDKNPDHAWQLASAVEIININAETVELFRAPNKKNLMGSIDKTFSETSINQFIDELYAFWNKEETFRTESAQLTFDGKEITVLISMPIPATLEEARSVPVSLLDITELKKKEAELIKANRALQLLSDCSSIVNQATNEQKLLTDICNRVIQDGSYPLAWVGFKDNSEEKNIIPVAKSGNGIEHLDQVKVTWCDGQHGQGPTGKAIKQGTPQVINDLPEDVDFTPWKERAAEVGYHSVIALPLKLESGEILGTLTIYAEPTNAFDKEEINLLATLAETLAFGIWDIRTEVAQKAAESKLRESEARFRSISSSSSIAMILATDNEGNIISCNPAAEITFGYAADEIIGKHLTILMPERYRQKHNNGFRRAIKEHTYKIIGKTVELSGLHKEGHEFPIELSLGMWEEDGKTYFSGVIHDISERKQMEKNLIVAQKMESVGQLSGGIAHDFNNLLGIIQGNLELINSIAKDNELIIKRTEPALRATQRGAELTKRLLGFSSRIAQDTHATSLNEVILRTIPLVEKSLTSLIKIEFDLVDDPWLTDIDPGDFENAIINLAINARDAMNGNGVLTFKTENNHLSVAEADLIPMAESGDYVVVHVSDDGLGMTPQVVARIFEPFYSTKVEGKGTGLGLSMVYGFVQRSGGFIDVSSEENIGTTFKVFLPKSSKSAVANIPENINISNDNDLPKGTETILVVDDEEDLLTVTAEELIRLGYTVLRATSAEEANKIIQSEQSIDLLLSDIVMPGSMDGYGLANHVIRYRPNIRLLLMSGYTSKLEEKKSMSDPILNYLLDHLLSKPFKKENLALQVRKALDSNITIPWDDNFSVGIKEIDEDHRVLISLLNKLFACIENNRETDHIRHVIEGVVDYTNYHFEREEALMGACDYPHLNNHRKVHRMMSEKVGRLASQVETKNDLELLGEFVQYLMSWLIDHIQAMDKSIEPFVAGKSKEITQALENIKRPVRS